MEEKTLSVLNLCDKCFGNCNGQDGIGYAAVINAPKCQSLTTAKDYFSLLGTVGLVNTSAPWGPHSRPQADGILSI